MSKKFPESKELYERLFGDLYENMVIYHERATMLCEVVRYEVTEEGFDIWLNWIKPLNLGIFYPRYMETREEIHLASRFDDSMRLYDGRSIGHPYCPFTLWTDKQTVEAFSKMSDDELEANVGKLLWNAWSPAI